MHIPAPGFARGGRVARPRLDRRPARVAVAGATALVTLATSMTLSGCGPEQAAGGASASVATGSVASSPTISASPIATTDRAAQDALVEAYLATMMAKDLAGSVTLEATDRDIATAIGILDGFSSKATKASDLARLKKLLLGAKITFAQQDADPDAVTMAKIFASDYAVTASVLDPQGTGRASAAVVVKDYELFAHLDASILAALDANGSLRKTMSRLAARIPAVAALMSGRTVAIDKTFMKRLISITDKQSPGLTSRQAAGMQKMLFNALGKAAEPNTIVTAEPATAEGTPVTAVIQLRRTVEALGAQLSVFGALTEEPTTASNFWAQFKDDGTVTIRALVKARRLVRFEIDLADITRAMDPDHPTLSAAAAGLLRSADYSIKVVTTYDSKVSIAKPANPRYMSAQEISDLFAAFDSSTSTTKAA